MTLKKPCFIVFGLLAVILVCLTAGCFPRGATVTEGQPSAGGVLRLYGIDPITLDPAISAEMTSHEYIVHIFSGLVRLDDELNIVPDIAESWDISADHRTYTFHLRRDVSFHDGKKVTAYDFQYSWERACNPATGSRSAATYLGDIRGADDVLTGRAKEISGVRVIDDYTLEVTVDAPIPYFLYKLTYPTAFVVDRANVAAGAEWWRKPNGTGAFRLKQWEKGSLLVLERNNRFYGEKAKLARVEFNLWGGIPMNMYETGEIDVAGVAAIYIDRVTDPAGPFSGELQVSPELSFSFIGFNTTRPPFDDLNVRKAFTMALDKDKIIALSFRNLVARADGILPPGLPGYNPDLAGLGYDVAGAREHVRRSRYGDSASLPPITFTTSGYGGAIGGYLEAIITQWRENLGVEVTVRQLEPDWFLYRIREEKDEMFDMGWVADYPHPQNFLEVLFHSSSENNFAGYASSAVDAILEEAGTEPDAEKSLELYRRAERLLVDDAACLPLWFGKNYVLVKPHVQGYRLNPLGFAWLNRVSVR
ncbi:MAG: peptide ABC transporter substrate-binding protein [Dehalococcoidales bacterium]|nr:peptide ABC transporter substrate-binding protein [Dehalococcoidales bacterium]